MIGEVFRSFSVILGLRYVRVVLGRVSTRGRSFVILFNLVDRVLFS